MINVLGRRWRVLELAATDDVETLIITPKTGWLASGRPDDHSVLISLLRQLRTAYKSEGMFRFGKYYLSLAGFENDRHWPSYYLSGQYLAPALTSGHLDLSIEKLLAFQVSILESIRKEEGISRRYGSELRRYREEIAKPGLAPRAAILHRIAVTLSEFEPQDVSTAAALGPVRV